MTAHDDTNDGPYYADQRKQKQWPRSQVPRPLLLPHRSLHPRRQRVYVRSRVFSGSIQLVRDVRLPLKFFDPVVDPHPDSTSDQTEQQKEQRRPP